MNIAFRANNIERLLMGERIAAHIIDFADAPTFESAENRLCHVANIDRESHVAPAIDLHDDAAHGVFEEEAVKSIRSKWPVKRTRSHDDRWNTILLDSPQNQLLGVKLAPLIIIRRVRRVIFIHETI